MPVSQLETISRITISRRDVGGYSVPPSPSSVAAEVGSSPVSHSCSRERTAAAAEDRGPRPQAAFSPSRATNSYSYSSARIDHRDEMASAYFGPYYYPSVSESRAAAAAAAADPAAAWRDSLRRSRSRDHRRRRQRRDRRDIDSSLFYGSGAAMSEEVADAYRTIRSYEERRAVSREADIPPPPPPPPPRGYDPLFSLDDVAAEEDDEDEVMAAAPPLAAVHSLPHTPPRSPWSDELLIPFHRRRHLHSAHVDADVDGPFGRHRHRHHPRHPPPSYADAMQSLAERSPYSIRPVPRLRRLGDIFDGMGADEAPPLPAAQRREDCPATIVRRSDPPAASAAASATASAASPVGSPAVPQPSGSGGGGTSLRIIVGHHKKLKRASNSTSDQDQASRAKRRGGEVPSGDSPSASAGERVKTEGNGTPKQEKREEEEGACAVSSSTQAESEEAEQKGEKNKNSDREAAAAAAARPSSPQPGI